MQGQQPQLGGLLGLGQPQPRMPQPAPAQWPQQPASTPWQPTGNQIGMQMPGPVLNEHAALQLLLRGLAR
ncbi:MAG: hypothetical protein AB7O44_27465 [Hyphomicrobiaceae bacterium]